MDSKASITFLRKDNECCQYIDLSFTPPLSIERQSTPEELQMTASDYEDEEFDAMRSVLQALKALPDDQARTRVLGYAASRLDLALGNSAPDKPKIVAQDGETEEGPDTTTERPKPNSYSTFAELFDDAHPQSNAERALVAGYWLQVCQGAESFSGQAVNTELKHLGEAIANITNALDSLKTQKPALALQLKKSGKSQQARKSYKITVAGERAVEAMING